MEQTKIMLPTDGSELAVNALKAALGIAKPMGAKIVAVFVIDSAELVDIATNKQGFEKYDALKNKGDEAVAYIVRECGAAGVECEGIVAEGTPAKYIVEKSADYSMIVMGTSAKKGLKKFFVGSVADTVIAEADCPVLTVKA